ncbi:MAG TPA: hypothetical protein VLV30_02050 [Methanomicrobiales archaeon]|nr:hypothetical protein [Methanomicrobiales archaeon]
MRRGKPLLLPGFLLGLLLVLGSLSAGCLSVGLGQVSYDPGLLRVQVSESGGPENAALQVNVFEFRDFRQVEVATNTVPVRLEKGLGTYTIPLDLGEGNYRLYLYVISGSDRRAGVIRDITVEAHGAAGPAPRISAG